MDKEILSFMTIPFRAVLLSPYPKDILYPPMTKVYWLVCIAVTNTVIVRPECTPNSIFLFSGPY